MGIVEDRIRESIAVKESILQNPELISLIHEAGTAVKNAFS